MDFRLPKDRLQTMKRELERRLKAIDADLRIELDHDSSERAVQVENDEVLRGMQVEAAEQMAAIDAALLRIERGTYGTCPRCDGPVGEKRLDALPYAALCIECSKAASG